MNAKTMYFLGLGRCTLMWKKRVVRGQKIKNAQMARLNTNLSDSSVSSRTF